MASCGAVQAAPLDVWLSATPSTGVGHLEFTADVVNDSVDVFELRDDDARYAGTSTGDYAGWHLHGRRQLTPAWSIDGGWWQRRVDFRSDPVRFHSWQVGTQYQWRQQDGWIPGSAFRAGAWGDRSSLIRRSTPVTVNGTTFETFEITDPQDTQVQGDWVAGWMLGGSTTFNVFAGAGRSRVSIGAVRASVLQGGCRYDLQIAGGRVDGRLATSPCGSLLDARFNVPVSLFNVDPEGQSNYSSTFAQAGFNLGWQHGPWSVKGGYLARQFHRDQVDDSLQAQNVTPVKTVQVLSSELGYQFTPQWRGLVRAELTSSQLMGDVPSLYNGLTASRLGRRYGLVSAGLVYVFR